MKRQSVGPKLRFAVFNRDNFTCQYCGRRSPFVELVADHIIPVAANGPTALSNLITACVECNSGKSSALLMNPLRQEPDWIKEATFADNEYIELRHDDPAFERLSAGAFKMYIALRFCAAASGPSKVGIGVLRELTEWCIGETRKLYLSELREVGLVEFSQDRNCLYFRFKEIGHALG